MLSLQRPYSLHCDFGSGLFSVPLELSGRKESGLRYASKTNYRTENYQFARQVLENGLAALQVTLDEIQVELFASQQQHIMQLYCSKQLNNAFRFFWKAMGLAYANPPFSLLAKVLTKIAYEGGRVVMCTPDWGCSGEHAYWRRMLDRMTVGRVQLPDGPIYVPEDSDTAMQAPEWASFLKVLPWVVVGAGGLGAGKTSGAGTRGVSLDVVIGGRTRYTDTNGGESSDNRSKVHADCGPAENPSL